jgi:hypothetical protein
MKNNLTVQEGIKDMTKKSLSIIERPAPAQVLQILDIILRVFSLLEMLMRLIGFFKPAASASAE